MQTVVRCWCMCLIIWMQSMVAGHYQSWFIIEYQLKLMNINQAIIDFTSACLHVHELRQPTLAEVLPFDLTAFQPAQQILYENQKDQSDESKQLRNKSAQLMRILQYCSKKVQKNSNASYQYTSKIASSPEDRSCYVEENRKSRAIQIKLKKIPSKQFQNKKRGEVEENEPSVSEVVSYKEEGRFRDENIDHSNFNRSANNQTSMKSEVAKNGFMNNFKKPSNIVELNKIEYRKSVPSKVTVHRTVNPFEHSMEERRQNECRGNCMMIKFDCCCSGAQNKVNQFVVKSPMNRSRVNTEYHENKNKARNCSRIERVQPKLKTEGNVSLSVDERDESVRKQVKVKEKVRVEEPKNVKINLQKLTPKTNYSKQQDKINKSKYDSEYQNEDYHRHKQFMEKSKEQRNSIENQRRKKEEEWRRKEQEWKRREQQELLKREEEERNRRNIRLREKKLEEEKIKQNNLLMKLKEEFSEICFQEPNEDERRVEEEIRQLEQKLGEIVLSNPQVKPSTAKVVAEPLSPIARVVRLDLTPSRANLHKNNSKVMTPRSPISQKPTKLLSQRISNMSRIV